MLVTSSQSSTHRPLGLSVEELYGLDRQYRRIEQQQQQHITQLHTPTRVTSSNLNRLNSRSYDPVSSYQTPLTALPSLEIHGYGYNHRPYTSSSSVVNYPRSYSSDQLRYAPPVLSTPPPSFLKHTYHQRSATNDTVHQRYQPTNRTYLQHPSMATGNAPSLGNSTMYNIPPSSTDHSDLRTSTRLRRQQPIKRESSRRIVVRPLVQRRREPSISSSCESLDESHSSRYHIPTEKSNISNQSVPFTPSTSLTTDVIDELNKETNDLVRTSSNNDSLSDDGDINLYEMRLAIGKTYDTSDISVQLEGPKILIHCYTIEPTDKRGNYRKHEYKTELLVPDVVDDETIVAYLTEDGQLIVEGKYQPWAWKEIKRKRKIEQQEINPSSTSILATTSPPSSINSDLISTRKDGGLEQEKVSTSLVSNKHRMMYNNNNNPKNRIENLDNNRTVIQFNEPKSSSSSSQQYTDTRSVNDIINRFNTLNTTSTPNIWDGQYRFTDDIPPMLVYHVCLPYDTLSNTIRIQSDPQLNILKILVEQQEKSLLPQQQQSKVIIRSTSRICRLPRDHIYDYTRLHVVFLKDNYIRIELPTLN